MYRSKKKPKILKQVVFSQVDLVSEGCRPISESEELGEGGTITQ